MQLGWHFITCPSLPFYTLDLPLSGVPYFSFLFHGLHTLELSFMYTVGSRKTTTSEVKRKKLQAVNAFWEKSGSLSPDNRGYSGSMHIYKYSTSDFLLFIFAFTITGQLQIFPDWHSLEKAWLGFLHAKGTETLYAGTQIMKWYGSNITCIIMLQFMLKKAGISSLIAALVSERSVPSNFFFS